MTGRNGENSLTNGTSVRRLAELAKAGYLLTRDPTLQVEFEVHHFQDVPGYFHSLVNEPSEQAPFLECLEASANGIGFIVGTRTGSSDDSKYRGSNSPGVVATDEDRRKVFCGVARPNPSFTFESARTFEAIISIGEPRPEQVTFAKSLLIKDALAYICHLAADNFGVPVLSAQWPAQIPPKVRGRPDVQDIMRREEAVPPHASSGALRFSLAVGESSTAVRMGLERQLIAYTEERGFGLWLADSRMGYRTGNWFHVRGYDADRVREHEEANDPDSRPVTICLPVTFVGPARVGSTNALLKLLRSLPFVGIIGTSNTTLDDLAFIHMQLSVRGLTTGDLVKANRRLADGVRSHHGGPLDVLGDVFRALDRREEFEANTRNGPELVLRAYDYKTLVRNVFPCIPPPGRRRMAIWFSWQIECEDSGLVNVMKGLYEAFQMTALIDMKTRAWTSREESPNIEYLICRRVDYSLLRGKGKISIPKDVIDKRFKDNDLERPASRFSMNLEAAWKTKLASIGGFRELTVAWREAWLGHWEPASY